MSDITKTLMLHVTLKSRICIYSVENIIILLFHFVHIAAILDFAIFWRLMWEIILGSQANFNQDWPLSPKKMPAQ